MSPTTGISVNLEEIDDFMFSKKLIGDGMGVVPIDSIVYSPISGEVSVVFPTLHAYGITADNGVEVLVHLGINTVSLNGEYFDSYVKKGDRVKEGDRLARFDIDKLKEGHYDTTVIVVCLNKKTEFEVKTTTTKQVSKNDVLFQYIDIASD